MTEVLRLAGIAILGAAMGAVLRAFGRKEAALVCEIACGLALLLRVLHGAARRSARCRTCSAGRASPGS